LRESEISLRGIIEGAADGVIILDHDGRVEFCNRVIRELVGCRANKACHPRLADLVSEEFRDLGEEAGIELKETGAFRGELPLLTASASSLTTEVNAIKLADGRSFLSFRDISQRKKTDAELVKAKEAAEAANRAKSQFLANVSHEMRTPMNGILGFASALEKTRLTENQREAVEMVLLSANHLLCIINDLLDLARIEAGKVNLVEEPVALEPFLEEIRYFFRPLAAAKI
jgi:PAS domain S-box-containing protein